MANKYPARIHEFKLAAGSTYQLPVAGAFFKLLKTTGDIEVVGDTFGTLAPLAEGNGMEKTPFQRLTIRDLSGKENTVRMIIAGENFIDTRQSGDFRMTGDFNIYDRVQAAATDGRTFMVSTSQLGATQLVNPAGSGKLLLMKSFRLDDSSGGQVTAELSWRRSLVGAESARNLVPKRRGSVPVSKVYYSSNTVAPDGDFDLIARLVKSTNSSQNAAQLLTFAFDSVLIVPPGEGVMWNVSYVTGAAQRLTAEFTEEPIVPT